MKLAGRGAVPSVIVTWPTVRSVTPARAAPGGEATINVADSAPDSGAA
ncbi:hypothetical protein M1C59_02505 [Gordonia terrae]|nr:hypothetical protein [Gordonia terrae]UPW09749.1 hypothetical protein M1C59_02505 [Gordonia terrae]